MDGCLVQNTINSFLEAGYYISVNIMVIFDYHGNIIAEVLGLETALPSKNSGYKRSAQRNRSTLELCRRRYDLPFIERTIEYN